MEMYLVTFKCDGEFVAEFMNMWQIADVYGCSDYNETSDHKVYRLTPDAEPERLKIAEERDGGCHVVALRTMAGEHVDDYEWPEH